MFTFKKVIYLFLFTIIANSAFSQTATDNNVSDEELHMFASAVQEIQKLDQQSQQKMMKAIQDAGLSIQQFTAIQKTESNPQEETEATDEELKKFKEAEGKVTKLREEVQTEMEKKIQDAGLTVERYQTISQTVQQDEELKTKVQEIMQSEGK